MDVIAEWQQTVLYMSLTSLVSRDRQRDGCLQIIRSTVLSSSEHTICNFQTECYTVPKWRRSELWHLRTRMMTGIWDNKKRREGTRHVISWHLWGKTCMPEQGPICPGHIPHANVCCSSAGLLPLTFVGKKVCKDWRFWIRDEMGVVVEFIEVNINKKEWI